MAVPLGQLKYPPAEEFLLSRLRHASTTGLAIGLELLGSGRAIHVLVETALESGDGSSDRRHFPPYLNFPIDEEAATMALSALSESRTPRELTDVFAYIAANGLGPRIAGHILAMHRNGKLAGNRSVRVQALRAVIDTENANTAVDLLRDGIAGWQQADEMVAALEAVADRVQEPLIAMLSSADVETRAAMITGLSSWEREDTILRAAIADRLEAEPVETLRIELAMMLANWNDFAGLPVLQRALAGGWVPSKRIGDSWEVTPLRAALIKRAEEAVESGRGREGARILETLVPCPSPDIARLILEHHDAWDADDFNLESHLENLPHSLVDLALDRVEEVRMYNPLLTQALSRNQAGFDQFLRLLRLSLEHEWARRPLLGMSRKSGVRVFADGRIVPIQQIRTE
ncbi:hypothetical protein [Nonomuraea typhae]|uniref:hypothetical protein n=1 Tax=Nonomuraea typhae TaxID=2603600 RepID=UPI0012F9F2D5|nr:hypothetical protein [Nonomuraea typhae]